MLDHLDRLPGRMATPWSMLLGQPRRRAGRFQVGLATLSLQELAGQAPLVCYVDAPVFDHGTSRGPGDRYHRLPHQRIASSAPRGQQAGDGNVSPGCPSSGPPTRTAILTHLLLATYPPLDFTVADQVVSGDHRTTRSPLLELPRTSKHRGLRRQAGCSSTSSDHRRDRPSYLRRLQWLPSDTPTAQSSPTATTARRPRPAPPAAGRFGSTWRRRARHRMMALSRWGRYLRECGRRSVLVARLSRSRRATGARASRPRDATITETDPARRAWHHTRAPGPTRRSRTDSDAARPCQARGVRTAASWASATLRRAHGRPGATGRARAAGQASCQAGAFDAALARGHGGGPVG